MQPSVYPNAGLWRHLVGPTGHHDAPRRICLTRNGGAEDREQKVTGPKAIGRYLCAAHTGARAAASPYPAAGLFYRGPQHSAGAPYHPPAQVERPLWPRGLVVCAVSSPRPRALETGGRVRVGGEGKELGGRPGHWVRARPRQPGLRRFSSQRLSPRPDAGREPHTAGGRPCAPCDPESPGPAGRAASGGARPSAALRPGRELALRLRPPCSLRRRHTVARCNNPVRCIASKRQGDIRPPKK